MSIETEKTEKFFIFTWKEILVIALLAITLLGFFFTLGLHYGKRITPPATLSDTTDESEKLEENPEAVPAHENLEEGSQHAKAVSAETIKEATKEELAKTGITTESPKAVTLPEEKISESKHEATHHETVEEGKTEGKTFLIQLGSYTSKKEASQKVKAFAKKGLVTEIRTAEVNHQTRYRVLIPGFKTKASADAKGKELKHKNKIGNYVVIK